MWREGGHIDHFPDARVARLAEEQHGVVSLDQLRALGLTKEAVMKRVRRGRLHRLHRGVYAVGHQRLAEHGRLWAAVLACGGPERAVLSHRSAAALWDLLPSPSVIEVTTLAQSRSMKGVRVHRAKHVETTTREALPVTTVPQTLLDLASTISEHRLRRACHRAEVLRVLDARSTAALIERNARRPGTARLAGAMKELAANDPVITRSELEERFLALVAAANLPAPATNARVGRYEVDFLWRARRLVVETDGAAAHLTATAFERDRERDQQLTLAGYRVVRFTWRQVVQAPGRVAAALRELLSEPR